MAVAAAEAAYRDAGLKVATTRHGTGFARLLITDADERSVKVEMGVDWRSHPPVRLEIGPVLHPDDAVGNKVAALYGRAEVRDFVDVFAVLRSGRYNTTQLMELAMAADPGFDTQMFRAALSALGRIPDQALSHHGLSQQEVQELRCDFQAWEATLSPEKNEERPSSS